MIRYALKCANEHRFESWFHSAEAFDRLNTTGHVECPACGSTDVEKALMAPGVAVSAETGGQLTARGDAREKELGELREKIEREHDYVGKRFASEARAMHVGDIPERPIYGEAKGAEVVELLKDGVPVAPLPFTPKAKAN